MVYLRVLALPTRGVLLKAFCRATILITYSVPGFRPTTKQQIQNKTLLTFVICFNQCIWMHVKCSTLTTDKCVALACVGPGGDFSGQTTSLLIGDIITSNPWAAGWLPGERNAVRVQVSEADIGGRDDQWLGWKRRDKQKNVSNRETCLDNQQKPHTYYIYSS